jgi:hypothetical protein
MATLFLLSDSISEPEKLAKMDGVKRTESSELFTKIFLEPGNYTFNIR